MERVCACYFDDKVACVSRTAGGHAKKAFFREELIPPIRSEDHIQILIACVWSMFNRPCNILLFDQFMTIIACNTVRVLCYHIYCRDAIMSRGPAPFVDDDLPIGLDRHTGIPAHMSWVGIRSRELALLLPRRIFWLTEPRPVTVIGIEARRQTDSIINW